MYSTLFTVALFFNIAISAVFADFSVATPQIFACPGKEVKVTWEAAKAPYNVLIVSADDPCGDALVDAGDFQQTFANVKTDKLTTGERVQVSIEDASGEEGWSGVVTVLACPAAEPATPSPVPSDTSSLDATTLIVPPAATDAGYDPAATSTVSVKPVGAANAGTDPFNNAATPRQISLPAMALTAIVGAVVLLL